MLCLKWVKDLEAWTRNLFNTSAGFPQNNKSQVVQFVSALLLLKIPQVSFGSLAGTNIQTVQNHHSSLCSEIESSLFFHPFLSPLCQGESCLKVCGCTCKWDFLFYICVHQIPSSSHWLTLCPSKCIHVCLVCCTRYVPYEMSRRACLGLGS